MDKALLTYEHHRRLVEQYNGFHNPGALGIAGWKGMKWSGLVWMYRNGKVSRDKAEEIRTHIATRGIKSAIKGFSDSDHIAHDEACGLTPKALKTKSNRANMVERIAQLEAELAALKVAK